MKIPKSKFYFLFLILNIGLIHTIESQRNLIPNPSFEITNPSVKKIKMAMQNFDIMDSWKATINSPDAFHPNIENINFIHKSPNFLKQFGVQEPRTGEGKAGIYIEGGLHNEGVTAMLSGPLSKGKYYYFHMYTSLAEGVSNSCTSSIGAYFSAVYPRITETSNFPLHIKSSKMICDSKEWTKICGVYRAKGNEKYISIGYFGNNPVGKSLKSGSYDTAYYFIDDLLLIEIQDTKSVMPETICNMALDFKDVEFLIGESEIEEDIKKSLNSYIQYAKVFKITAIKIIGHANDGDAVVKDETEEDEENKESEIESGDPNEMLSLARANNVKAYFIENGIPEELIEAIGIGNTSPIEEIDGKIDAKSNSRVQIKFE